MKGKYIVNGECFDVYFDNIPIINQTYNMVNITGMGNVPLRLQQRLPEDFSMILTIKNEERNHAFITKVLEIINLYTNSMNGRILIQNKGEFEFYNKYNKCNLYDVMLESITNNSLNYDNENEVEIKFNYRQYNISEDIMLIRKAKLDEIYK